MKTNALKLLGLFVVIPLLATCTDQTPTANDDAEALSPTLGSALTCDLNHATKIPSDVKSFFLVNTVRNAAGTVAKQLGDACAASNQALATSRALTLLGMMETELGKPNATGAASVGARLTRALLACTTDLGCTINAFAPYAVPEATALENAFGATGLFAIRGATNANVVARAPFSFTDDLNRPNSALFGTQVATNWAGANNSAFVFFYGYRADPTFVGEGVVANNVGYSFNRWPDNGTFAADGLVHVGACFAKDVGFAHAPGEPDPKGRMQREGTLLSEFTNFTFCPSAPSSASILAPVKALAMGLLPRTWSAMFFGDIRTPVIGGSAYDFSNFAPAGANTAGSLDTIPGQVPAAGTFLKVGDPLNIRILAQSGGLTPMERVPVELYVAGNQGFPAGAEVVADPSDTDPSDGDGTWGFTSEEDGTVLLTGSVGKPGAYTLCARVRNPPGFTGFTFTEVCTKQFNVVQ